MWRNYKFISIFFMLCGIASVAHAQKAERDYLRKGNRAYKDSLFTDAEIDYRKALDVNPTSTIAERHRRGKQYHAYHRTRTYPRVRHPESSGSQTDVYPVAHYLGECGHHYFFRLYRHGGRHCRHRIYESDSRQTDRRCGCVQRNGFRKPDSRPQHSCSGHTHTDNCRYACRTLSGT